MTNISLCTPTCKCRRGSLQHENFFFFFFYNASCFLMSICLTPLLPPQFYTKHNENQRWPSQSENQQGWLITMMLKCLENKIICLGALLPMHEFRHKMNGGRMAAIWLASKSASQTIIQPIEIDLNILQYIQIKV